MKNYLKTGLLALTIAFGVTSCDKNGIDDIESPLVGTIENQNYSKVTFGEDNSGLVSNNSKSNSSNEAGKNHNEFSHLYSSDDQTLVIYTDTELEADREIVFKGTYTAGNLSVIDPLDNYAVPIILQNGDYVAETINNGGNGAGYLPYTSMAAFRLDSQTGVITLQATLLKGFLIVDAQRATEGGRITGVTATLQGSDGSSSIDLLEDARDNFNDHYAYLAGGDYDIVVSYLLDNNPETIDAGSVRIGVGAAYTLEVGLNGDTPVSSDTTTSDQSINEADLAGDDLEAYTLLVNNDDDFLDDISRVVSSTITTTSGVAGDPVLTYGDWSIVSDIDVSSSSAPESSNEGAIRNGEGFDINGDGDKYDTLTRIVTTTITSTNGVPGVGVPSNGAWSIDEDFSQAGFGEAGTGTSNFDVREYSIYGPALGVQIDDFTQTRAVTNAEGSTFDPDVIEMLSRDVVVTSETTLAAVVGTDGVLTYTAVSGIVIVGTHNVAIPALIADGVDVWEDNGDEIGGDVTFTNDGSPVLEYSYDGGTFGSLVDAQAAADAAIATEGDTVVMIQVQSVQSRLRQVSAVIQPEIYVVNGDQDGDIEAGAMRSTQVVTAAVVDGAADDAAPVAGTDTSYTVSNAITNTDLARSDFTEGSGLVWTADSGEQFRIAFTTVPSAGYTFQIFANGAYGSVSSVYNVGSDDDANYFTAVDAAIAAINAAN